MIEFDVDMGYLLEEGELDCVVLNDENGEHEPMTFRLGGGECETCHGESDLSEWVCSECQCWIPLGLTPENIGLASEWRYCPHCGRKVKAVKR